MSAELLRTVIVAEDHAMVRSGLCALIAEDGGLAVAGNTGSIAGARRLVHDRSPDVLVLDLNLSDGSSLPAISELALTTRVVVLTMDASAPKAREALRRGADGFVLKDAADEELGLAIHAALGGGRYLSRALRPCDEVSAAGHQLA